MLDKTIDWRTPASGKDRGNYGPQRIVCLTDKQYSLANTFSTPGRNLFTT